MTGDCYAGVRREARRCIPGVAGRNSKGGFWVAWFTWTRKREGQEHAREAVAV